jgi:hypothetical protein
MINALLLYVSLVCASIALVTGEIIAADRLLSHGALRQIAEIRP